MTINDNYKYVISSVISAGLVILAVYLDTNKTLKITLIVVALLSIIYTTYMYYKAFFSPRKKDVWPTKNSEYEQKISGK